MNIINNDISDCSNGQLLGAPSKYGGPRQLPALPAPLLRLWQFFKLVFSLANHCSQACSAFDRILAGKKTCQKCKRGKMEVIRMQIIFILCQHEVAVSQNMNYTYE